MQLKAMTVPPAPCCGIDASIATVRQTLDAHDCDQVLVLDARRRLLGRVRRADLPDDERPLALYLRTPAFWLRDDASVDELAQLMYYQRLQQVPISDASDAIYGLIGRAELARWPLELEPSQRTVHDECFRASAIVMQSGATTLAQRTPLLPHLIKNPHD